MNGRPLALVFMLVATLLSFGLAVYTALQGRIPIIETAHALIFATFGLILASKRPAAQRPECVECGSTGGWELGFCSGCGRIPRANAPGRTPSASG